MTTRGRTITIGILGIILCAFAACSIRNTSTVPSHLLGLTIGMDRADAERRLQDIADLERKEKKNQEVWTLRDDPRFSMLAVGFDRADKVRYVTGFVDSAKTRDRLSFASVGDLSLAKAEIMAPHYRYVWDVPASGGAAYSVNVYGDNPQFVTIYSLVVGKPDTARSEDAEVDDD